MGPGAFDESGVTSSWIVSCDGRRYHYYTGWRLGTDVPFHLQIGLAIEDEQGICRKVLDAPVLDRNDADPHLTASPCVLIENDVWRMWYVSGLGWKPAMPKPDNGGRYMLYNGNGYGRTGIGLAVLDRGILGHGTADPSAARL